jgi:hypothetical protein
MYAGQRLRTVIKEEAGPCLEANKSLKSSRSYIHNVMTIVRANTVTNIESYKTRRISDFMFYLSLGRALSIT